MFDEDTDERFQRTFYSDQIFTKQFVLFFKGLAFQGTELTFVFSGAEGSRNPCSKDSWQSRQHRMGLHLLDVFGTISAAKIITCQERVFANAHLRCRGIV